MAAGAEVEHIKVTLHNILRRRVQPAIFNNLAPAHLRIAVHPQGFQALLLQQERLEALGMHCNAQMGRSEVVKYCRLDAAAQNVMERYFNMLNLSARSHDRILKVARTIADLAGSENIEAVHLAEAIQLRTSVRP